MCTEVARDTVHIHPKYFHPVCWCGGLDCKFPEPGRGELDSALTIMTMSTYLPDSNKPTDILKQSMPFSYMSISAISTDGNSHDFAVYSDISAEWVTGDNSLTVNWTTTTGDVITHQVQLESQSTYGEVSDHIQGIGPSFASVVHLLIYRSMFTDGSAYYSTLNVGSTNLYLIESVEI